MDLWHGTTTYRAIRILLEGFRILPDARVGWGSEGTFREGVYVTPRPSVARGYGEVLLRCRLRRGTRVLWLQPGDGARAIEKVLRRFGREVLDGRFSRALPEGKQLKKAELAALAAHLFHRESLYNTFGDRRRKTELRAILRAHKFDGVGERHDVFGVAIFDPARVEAVDAWQDDDRTGRPEPYPAEDLAGMCRLDLRIMEKVETDLLAQRRSEDKRGARRAPAHSRRVKWLLENLAELAESRVFLERFEEAHGLEPGR